jgi:hypothetical protein
MTLWTGCLGDGSLFLLPSIPVEELAKDPKKASSMPALQDPSLRKLVISSTHARTILRYLAADGVSAATVFPGYKGVVESLEERRRWQSPAPSVPS